MVWIGEAQTGLIDSSYHTKRQGRKMGTYQEQLALLEQILKNQWPIGIRRADDQEVIMRGKEEFRREAGKLEFNVKLEAAAPAIDIATFGLTLNFILLWVFAFVKWPNENKEA
jgi:hypothetical protein